MDTKKQRIPIPPHIRRLADGAIRHWVRKSYGLWWGHLVELETEGSYLEKGYEVYATYEPETDHRMYVIERLIEIISYLNQQEHVNPELSEKLDNVKIYLETSYDRDVVERLKRENKEWEDTLEARRLERTGL